MNFDFVPFHEVASEIAPHVPRHYTEMSEGDDYGTPNIDWETYLSASHQGQLMTVTARDKGELVGYGVYVIGRNMRYKHIVEATCHGVFLEKPYRGRYGADLLKRAHEFLTNAGIMEINYIESDERLGLLLEKIGYQSKYRIWSSPWAAK